MLSFAQACRGFSFSNQTANRSPNTISWYDGLLKDFEQFLLEKYQKESESLPLDSITRDDVLEFIARLQTKECVYEHHRCHKPEKRKLSPFTISGYVRALASFFHWAVNEHIITASPVDGVKRPKTPQPIKLGFSEKEVEKLLKACDQDEVALGARNKAIILFLLDSGVRASELCTLTMETLDPEYRRALIFGKGLKQRYVLLGARVRQAMWQYVHVYRPEPKEINAVFLTKFGKPLDHADLAHILRRIGDRAGVPGVHPHRFRHAFARLFLRNGGDLFSLQTLLGHQSITTTQVYLRMESEDLERTHERCSPVDRLERGSK